MKLLPISKERNLKANHNPLNKLWDDTTVVTNIKRTKSESKSQRLKVRSNLLRCCYQYQKNEIWKQITTPLSFSSLLFKLLPISKERNLKANHNIGFDSSISTAVVTNIKRTKSESKSQPILVGNQILWSCYQYQKNEIWKQITTLTSAPSSVTMLLPISKERNLKANHNS